jgi:hypothetical protein
MFVGTPSHEALVAERGTRATHWKEKLRIHEARLNPCWTVSCTLTGVLIHRAISRETGLLHHSRTLTYMALKPFLQKVDDNPEGEANDKKMSGQPASQYGLECTRSSRGAQNRILPTLDKPSFCEGAFVFDVFGEGDDSDNHGSQTHETSGSTLATVLAHWKQGLCHGPA